MDRARGLQIVVLRGIVWRSTMGFHSKSFRFEGGGRSKIIGMVVRRWESFYEELAVLTKFCVALFVCFVSFFVYVDLNRSGKSCRLRWVNYLHPGLRRGKMTPQEERLVLELHSKWGNRWSRIAKKLPGRTDNEIKNYWRTHVRKMEKKRTLSPSSSTSTSSSNCSSSSNITTIEEGASFYDTGGAQTVANSPANENMKNSNVEKDQEKYDTCGKREYSLDDIWKEINLPEMNSMKPVYSGSYVEETCKFSCPSPSPMSWESLFKMDDEDENQFLSCFDYGKMG